MHVPHYDKRNARTLTSYRSVLGLKSRSTQKLFQSVINNVKIMPGTINVENITKYDKNNIYDFLQDWIIWNNKRGMAASSVVSYFNALRSYLWYLGIRLDGRDVRQNLIFPQVLHETQIPATADLIRKILCISRREFKFQLLALLSSGMRVSELGQINTAHLNFAATYPNIMVYLPAEITKTGCSRITFFSKQVSDMIRYRIDKSHNADSLFCGTRNLEQSRNLILKRFAAARKKADIMDKYGHCKANRYKIHLHSLRSYFITKLNRVHFGLGHILAGHSFYMKEYNLYTVDELHCMYKKCEKDLTFRNAYSKHNV